MSYQNRGFNPRGGNRGHVDSNEDLKNRLTSLIIKIGDKPSSAIESNIDGLVNALLHDITTQKEAIQNILFKCISQLPYKTPIYGTIVGIINAKNAEFGKEVVCRLVDEINSALLKKQFNQLKLLIRFIPELINANVLPITAIFELFETLLSFLNSNSYTQNKSDYYVYLVLATLPWIGERLSKTNLGQLNALVEEVESYFSTRSNSEKKFYQPYKESDDKLESILKYIKSLRDESNWHVDSILQPYLHFQEVLNTATQHILPPIVIPDDSKYEYPLFTGSCFRLIDDLPMKPIEKFIVEEYLVDIMYFFNSNHREASRFLYSLPVTFEIDEIVVECILSEIFRLPESTFKPIYYSVLFIDLFKTQQSIIPAFAFATNHLFETLDQLDIEIIDRFAGAFAHHLSNFDYKWIWNDWEPILVGDSADQSTLLKRYFIKRVLESIVRLSYLEKIKSVLPLEYHAYLPPSVSPCFKFYQETTDVSMGDKTVEPMENKELVSESHKLLLLFTTKEPLDGIISHIANIPASVNVVELLTKCILHIGVTSFSHLTYAIERYITLFKAVFKTPADHQECIRSILEFWRNSQQHQVIVIDKFVTFKILNPQDTIQYFFRPENYSQITETSTWEIIHNSIQKTMIVIDVLSQDLEANKDSAEIQQKLDSALQEQQQLFITLLNGLNDQIQSSVVQSHPLNLKLITGYLKSVSRKYFNQIKPILLNNSALMQIINKISNQ
ncbi:initiation factor eIF-4 gamma middle domain-containing protein [Tieghemostelium lacteum]|uniref:Initiation factor eIF-4 gamma middle domain-containing protein n=1 Tax=Tieghemostelium lacteum TaxID=361077 RepID=A0A152A233_TIELA|nr:initiation factor eIF-4 gamma middle domain-containing protein [Tieghemostelium lacteum]|eukprot:KYR00264.1 initiation factor eIF-4 gamma middle domain-containing protein [Tieghemostelium lacteum]